MTGAGVIAQNRTHNNALSALLPKGGPLQGGNHKFQNRACLKWVFPLLPASAARLLFAGEAGSRSAPDVPHLVRRYRVLEARESSN